MSFCLTNRGVCVCVYFALHSTEDGGQEWSRVVSGAHWSEQGPELLFFLLGLNSPPPPRGLWLHTCSAVAEGAGLLAAVYADCRETTAKHGL